MPSHLHRPLARGFHFSIHGGCSYGVLSIYTVNETTLECNMLVMQVNLETLQSSASERPQYMPTATAIHCVTVAEVGQGRPKSKDCSLQRLPHICHSAKYELFSCSHHHTGSGKPESRSRRFDSFLRRSRNSRSHMPSTRP